MPREGTRVQQAQVRCRRQTMQAPLGRLQSQSHGSSRMAPVSQPNPPQFDLTARRVLCAACPQDYHQEIQDVMGTAFGVPEDIDEASRRSWAGLGSTWHTICVPAAASRVADGGVAPGGWWLHTAGCSGEPSRTRSWCALILYSSEFYTCRRT